MKQIAESITRVTHARKVTQDLERKQSFAEMVLEKYGPPIVRKTRQMASNTIGKKSVGAVPNKSTPTQSVNQESEQSKKSDVNKENVGFINRPLILVKSL